MFIVYINRLFGTWPGRDLGQEYHGFFVIFGKNYSPWKKDSLHK
jgi:hypothetical protein